MPRKADFLTLSGAGAIGFAVVIVLANVVLAPAGPPHTGAATDEVVAFFSESGDVVGAAVMLTPLAWALATLFGAGAVAALWPAERERGEAWCLVGFAGLILQNTTFTGVVAIRLALAQDPTARLWPLHDAVFTLNGTFLALAMTGLSVGGVRSGLVHRWHATLGLVAAVLQFTSATLAPVVIEHGGPFGLIGLVGWLMWVLWLIGYGVALIRSAPERSGARARTS